MWIVYSLFWIGLIFYVRVYKPWILIRNPFLVAEVTPEQGGAYSLLLKPKKDKVFRFQAGQFAWLTANNSPFSDAEHPFTIASSAENRKTVSFTIKELGDFSSSIKSLKPGQEVYVDGPFGAFTYERHLHAEGFMFIAGGIGITPMMSMLRSLADREDKRPLVLLYANRNWEGITFREEVQALQQRLNLKVIHVLENPPDDWVGDKGFITAELIMKNLPEGLKPNIWEVFICGPLPMMNAVENMMPTVGVSVGDFHSERFDLV